LFINLRLLDTRAAQIYQIRINWTTLDSTSVGNLGRLAGIIISEVVMDVPGWVPVPGVCAQERQIKLVPEKLDAGENSISNYDAKTM
jgi:hypothetical protein